jgi:hypothetical protein
MHIAKFIFVLLLQAPAAVFAVDSVAAQADAQSPWWLGHLLTALGTLVAAGMIVFQLGRQHKNEIRLQAENFKGQLRLQVYQEFSSRLASTADALSTSSMYAFTGPTHVEMFLNQIKAGINPNAIADRALAFKEKNAAATNEIVEVVFLIEKYFILHPELDIFRLALSSAAHDMGNAFHALFEYMLKNFPIDIATQNGVRVENVKVFSEPAVAEHKRLSAAYYDAAHDLDSYLSDMRTELQMLLLSSLFPNVIPRRRPADPAAKVISLDAASVKSLRQHFLKSTEWGRRTVQTQMEVHREFHGRF